ncbi:hypothetical protein ACFU7T_19000 [Streptomyces sp. NPDC057555]|uniref:hypothetical protein n=1 Tax=Streptomyces sp. NPDC057555 TaxID=3346166 RepID=UPI0036BEB198
MTFDRVEAKFIADRIVTGRSEAEVRLAAFRHDFDQGAKVCVSASSTVQLTGTGAGNRNLGELYIRWIHQIPFGWDYSHDATIYTIELQHRYAVGPTPDKRDRLQVFGHHKRESDKDPEASGGFGITDSRQPGGYAWVAYQAGANRNPTGYVTIPEESPPWDGAYAISNMHYCVGLPSDRLPTASTIGHWRWRGTNGKKVRNPDITEDYIN